MKITISRWELFSHHLEEEIELDKDLIEETLEWATENNKKIENSEDFFEVLEEFLSDHEIDDPKLKEKVGSGEFYPSGDGHDWNHVSYDEETDSEAMINEAIARFNARD